MQHRNKVKYKYRQKSDIMKTAYNKSKIMRNAWYLKSVQPTMTFCDCLKKAWRNEKRSVLSAMIEGRNLAEEDARAREVKPWAPVAVPDGYYGERGRYYGD